MPRLFTWRCGLGQRHFSKNFRDSLYLPLCPMWASEREIRKQCTQPSDYYSHDSRLCHCNKKIQLNEPELNFIFIPYDSFRTATCKKWHSGLPAVARGWHKEAPCPGVVKVDTQVFKIVCITSHISLPLFLEHYPGIRQMEMIPI